MSDNSWAELYGTCQEKSQLENIVRPLWAWGKGIAVEGNGREDSRFLESPLSCPISCQRDCRVQLN